MRASKGLGGCSTTQSDASVGVATRGQGAPPAMQTGHRQTQPPLLSGPLEPSSGRAASLVVGRNGMPVVSIKEKSRKLLHSFKKPYFSHCSRITNHRGPGSVHTANKTRWDSATSTCQILVV